MVLKKEIKDYDNRRQINIVKKDNLFDVNEVYVYTSEEHNNITSRLSSLKDEVATIKSQLAEANALLQEKEANMQESIAVARSEIQQEYEAKLNDKNNTISKQQDLIADKDSKIKDYEDKAIEVNEVIARYNEANIERSRQHNKEVTALTEANMYITNKYNALRQAIINTSKISYLFSNAKKQLLIEYQEVKPSDKEAIETKAKDPSDT